MDMARKKLEAVVQRESRDPPEHRIRERRRSEERDRRLEKEFHFKSGRGDGEESTIAIVIAT